MAVAHRLVPDLDATWRAFDAAAPAYDTSNRSNPILEAMRARSLTTLTTLVPSGSRVLDLGCGPGTDFAALGAAGYQLLAVDGAAAMVEEARARASALASTCSIRVDRIGIHELDRLGHGVFDAAYSSFGPLNCVPDLDRAARLIAARLRPGGVLVASVIGRVCPWELIWHAWRCDWARLRVRFARDFVAVPMGAGTIWTRYYSPAEFERPFAAAGFARVSLRGLGVCMPPPYMEAAAARHPRAAALLQRFDDRVSHWPGLRQIGDHFLIALQRY